jgi:hypothetical protein
MESTPVILIFDPKWEKIAWVSFKINSEIHLFGSFETTIVPGHQNLDSNWMFCRSSIRINPWKTQFVHHHFHSQDVQWLSNSPDAAVQMSLGHVGTPNNEAEKSEWSCSCDHEDLQFESIEIGWFQVQEWPEPIKVAHPYFSVICTFRKVRWLN